MSRLLKSYSKSPEIIKLGVLESQILGETSSPSNQHTTQSQMIFVMRWLK